jgi:hypothetical protein
MAVKTLSYDVNRGLFPAFSPPACARACVCRVYRPSEERNRIISILSVQKTFSSVNAPI